MPDGHRIIVDCGSETKRICKFTDHFLQHLQTCHPSYIKDTYHCVDKIRGQVKQYDALIVKSSGCTQTWI